MEKDDILEISFPSMFKNVPNTNKASSSGFTPLLNNTSGMSKVKRRTEPEANCLFLKKQLFNTQSCRACYDSQTYLHSDTKGLA